MTDAVKRCSCREHKGPNPIPVTEFGNARNRPDGLKDSCRACRAREDRRRYETSPDKIIQKNRRWRRTNLAASLEINNRSRARARDQVFDHYGRACTCCGATDDLTIDHVDGGGQAHRIALFGRNKDAGARFYRWLIRNNFPPGYATLCRRCDASKGTGRQCRLDHRRSA